MSRPILITGAARSGTSMTAGIIDLSGAFGGKTSPPTPHNKKGMFENRRIRNHVVKPYLDFIGADRMGQKPLPTAAQLRLEDEHVQDHREQVLDIFKSQGYDPKVHPTWYYKGAKICLIWPLWAKCFPDAQWIIVRRDAEDIVRSCLRTGFMRAYDTRAGWLGWLAEHEKRFEEMVNAGLDVSFVWPQKMINGDFTEIQTVVNRMGLEFDLKATAEFVEPKLWKRGQGGTKHDE